jgi:hypothetical protein
MFELILYALAYVVLGIVIKIMYISWCVITQSYPRYDPELAYIGPFVFLLVLYLTRMVMV